MPEKYLREEFNQKQSDEAQRMHAEHVEAVLEERRLRDEAADANITTQQTTKAHIGKHFVEEDLDPVIAAKRTGLKDPGKIRKIDYKEEETGEVVGVIQVTEAQEEAGVTIAGGDVPLTEPQKVGRAIREAIGDKIADIREENEEGGVKRKKKKG